MLGNPLGILVNLERAKKEGQTNTEITKPEIQPKQEIQMKRLPKIQTQVISSLK